MKGPVGLRITCPHLEGPRRRYGLLASRRNRPVTVRLNGGNAAVTVDLCRGCADRLGVNSPRSRAAHLAALTVLHRHLHSRLATICDALAEMVPLLIEAPPAKPGPADPVE